LHLTGVGENNMAYTSEREMVESIIASDYIKELITSGHSLIKEEVDGFFGIPDIVVVINNAGKQLSYAYEAKLKNWRRAIMQAFRYKAFVDLSYVIMDYDHVKPALLKIEEFERSNVGLMSIDDYGELKTHYRPHKEIPYSPHTAFKFNKMVMREFHIKDKKSVQFKITDNFM
jgi:hypothetical protein